MTPQRASDTPRGMRSLLTMLLATACYRAPDLPTTPYQAPPLISDENSPVRICAPERDVRVACTVDGDTFDAFTCGQDAGGERFRMLGIDAPETEKPGKPADCYADIAAQELRRVLSNRFVTLAFDRTCTDVYGRTLAYVWMDLDEARNLLDPRVLDELEASADVVVSDTGGTASTARVLINTYMLLAGYARRFDEDWVEPLRFEAEMIAAERLASVRANGLWAACE